MAELGKVKKSQNRLAVVRSYDGVSMHQKRGPVLPRSAEDLAVHGERTTII